MRPDAKSGSKPDPKQQKTTLKDLTMSLADDWKAQLEKMKLKPDQIYTIHNKIRTLTNTFDLPGPDMRDVLDFDVPREFSCARASICAQGRIPGGWADIGVFARRWFRHLFYGFP